MQKTAEQETDYALLNMIAPVGLSFSQNDISIGESRGKAYGITKYPDELSNGWLSKITNLTGTIVSVSFKPIPDEEIIPIINANARQLRGREQTANDTLSYQRAKKAADNCEKLMEQIDQKDETVGELGVVIMPMANNESLLAKIERRVRSICVSQKCKIRLLSNNQKEAFRQISLSHQNSDVVKQIIDRVAPLRTVVGGFPFASSTFNDGAGYYFAKDTNGGLMIVDLWKRGDDRTNSNLVIMGPPGVGKSTKIKDIMLSEYMMGTKIIAIDPEREYKEFFENLNGDWINAGGGQNGKINPLQIKGIPTDDEDKENDYYQKPDKEIPNDGMGAMALYIKHLEIFFALYFPSLTDMDKAMLKRTLIELYRRFGITWDTDIKKFKNEDFPIIKDLYDLLLEEADAKQKEELEEESKACRHLAILLEDAAIGADSFLWNGYTSIKTDSRAICLDTHDLQDTPDNIKRTQYFNICSWAWNEMSRDRKEKVLLICDESYLMIDPEIPQSLVFLRNAEKRGRKYEAALAIVSHSVVDFLDPRIKMYGQALLDLPTYKILMGSEGRDLAELTELYKLTEAECELLQAKKRGEALLMIGSNRMHVKFDIPEYKFQYFGSAGGR